MTRVPAGILLLLLLLPACLGPGPAPTTPTVVSAGTPLPLPPFAYPATPAPPVVSGGRTYTVPVWLEHDITASRSVPGIVLYRRDIPYADQASHELTHIFTSYIGYPFLEEGLAVYTSMLLGGTRPWPMNGVAAGRQVAAALTGGRYTALPTAFRFAGLGKDEFSSLLDKANVQTMYREAGAFAQFMIGRYGLAAYRGLLAVLDPAAGAPVPGQVASLTDLDSAFRAWLGSPAANEPPPAPPTGGSTAS